MKSKRSHEGYLLIDNSQVPGIGMEEAGKLGKEVVGAGFRGRYESAVLTCSHCHSQVVLNPMRTRERGYCRKCDHYVCDNPGCNAECNGSLNAVMDRLQDQAIRAQAPDALSGYALRKIILP
jgi:hypothetical protein